MYQKVETDTHTATGILCGLQAVIPMPAVALTSTAVMYHTALSKCTPT